MNNTKPAPAPTAPTPPTQPPSLQVQASEGLWQWLAEQDVSLALTTYQSNRLFLIGRNPEPGRLAVQERLFDKPMGLFWQPETDRLTLGCRYQIWQLGNRLPAGQTHEDGDRLYVPSQAWITGDVNAHDLAFDRDGRLLFVNTDFSCLATLDPDFSFRPIWQPPFIKKLVAEDRCHLNGLAMVDGEATYMSACSQTDTAAGWRQHRHDGGVVLHLPSNQIIATGLSMPHSPRWYRDRLWLLNSGSGELGYLDSGRDGERFVPVAYGPGFVRGLAFHDRFALIGLSQLRSTSFGGLALEQRLAADGQQAQCGLMVVDLDRGEVIHWLRFGNLVEELFDLVVIPGARRPRALGLQEDDIERLVSFPGSNGLVITKPTVRRPGHTRAPVAGLPRPEPGGQPVLYQSVHNLTPDNLLPYDRMTAPPLSQRWASQPPRGELLGLSAAIAGELIGFAIAERFQAADGSPQAELISLFVAPAQRRRGIGSGLVARLRQQLDVALTTPLLRAHHGQATDQQADQAPTPAPATELFTHAGYRVLDVYQRLSAPEREEIVAFWLEQQLLPPAEAQRRVDEVCFLVRHATGALVGIGSLYPGELSDNGQERHVFYGRTYLHPSARGHVRLYLGLLQAARTLIADPRLCRSGATAIAFETENPRLMSRAWRRLFTPVGY
ncbi:MAG: TIGR03032 family protein [Lamprobacter sp.]|uniref:TIGR03032 family protein n=1 Tax=Lamprobacter sp. TaxID=3100796 RepID=UPI002B2583DF|nr:TIGR03032 family protein [Lamprobacter sp.]MEA3642349.1 TIGR03032 family protein [Lamprobacter sp.]